MATIQSFNQASATSAAAPPAIATTRLSTSSCRTSWPRVAPSARRTAIFADAARRSRQREVRDVDARDDEQQCDGAHQHAERRPDAIGQLALHALEAQRPLHVSAG